MSTEEVVVIEKTLAGYRLPDDAVDLSAWLRDGLAVYNLFQYMKPMFFQMLEAHGGEFRGSWAKATEDGTSWRVHFSEEDVGGEPGDEGWDRLIIAKLLPPGEPLDVNTEIKPIEPVGVGAGPEDTPE